LLSFFGSDEEEIDQLDNVTEEECNSIVPFLNQMRENFEEARENQMEKVVDCTTLKLDSRYVEHDVSKEKELSAAVQKVLLGSH
jgi:hypothetical protein